MIELIPFNFLSIPVFGNLFTVKNSDFSIVKKNLEIGTVNTNITLVLHINRSGKSPTGTIRSRQSPVIETNSTETTMSTGFSAATHTQDTEEQHAAKTYDRRQDHTSRPIDAPCTVYTKMIFSDKKIWRFGSLNLGVVPLHVFSARTLEIDMDKYGLISLTRRSDAVSIESKEHWKFPTKPKRYRKIKEFNNLPVRIHPMSPIAQVQNGRYTVTLYRAMTGRTVTIAGQDCVFAKEVFDSLHFLALRSDSKAGLFIRKLSAIVIPKEQSEQ